MAKNNLPKTEEELISTFHKALAEFPVQIYNAETNAKKVALPQAFEYLSGDLRTVKSGVTELKVDVTGLKTDVKEHNDLLEGIKERRKIFISIYNTADVIEKFIKKSKIWKIISIILFSSSSIYGFIKILGFIFGWNLL